MYSYMIENDQIYVEGNVAWFVERHRNSIITMNMKTGLCKIVAKCPLKRDSLYRCNPILVKYKNFLILLPDTGDAILIYNIEKRKFDEIRIEKDEGTRIGVYYHWEIGHNLYFLASGMDSLFKLDMNKMQVEQLTVVLGSASSAVMVDKRIYVTSHQSNLIYEYCITDGMERYYEVPLNVSGIGTICYGGNLFWFSGNGYEIYSWNKETNEVKTYDDFPDEFVIYDNSADEKRQYGKNEKIPMKIFDVSLYVADKILFLPLNSPKVCCNRMLYMDVTNSQMGSILLANGQTRGGDIVEYIEEERVVAIFSQENDFISEIDMRTLDIKRKCMYMDWGILLEWQRAGHYIPERTSKDILGIVRGDFLESDVNNESCDKVGMLIYKNV